MIGICGGIPGDWETSGLYRQADFDVFHLAGNADEFYAQAIVETYEDRLKKRARSVVLRFYDAQHEIVPKMRDDVVQWLTRATDEH